MVCRLAYRQVRTEPNGGGWRTDYPYGEINLTIRLSELTRTPVSRDARNDPNYYVVTALDAELFQCPFLMASDVGTVGFTQEEADRLRTYFLKGGFLWVDDFWGDAAWDQWSGEIAKALPPGEFAIEDVPIDDPIFRSQFIVTKVPQITNIRFWRSTRGQETSERGEETRRGALPRHPRPQRAADGGDDPQHGCWRFVGARRRGSGVLLPVLSERVRARHQRAAPRDDALIRGKVEDAWRASGHLHRPRACAGCCVHVVWPHGKRPAGAAATRSAAGLTSGSFSAG